MELITLHTHTNYTGHGEGSVEGLVAAAEAAGISTIAVTEHYPLSVEIDPTNYVSMPSSKLDQYLSDIEHAQELHPSIEVLPGCELDWLGDDEDRDMASLDFSPFVQILGSVHYVDLWPFDDPAQRDRWDEVGPDEIWKRYFELWCQAVTCKSAPFTTMAHPDLVKKFAYWPSFDPQSLYDEAAEACASSGRMIEVNTSGKWYACKEMFPAPALLEAFCKAGVPCTVGTDAHCYADVDRGIRDAYKLMYDAGYREVTCLTRSGDRRGIAL